MTTITNRRRKPSWIHSSWMLLHFLSCLPLPAKAFTNELFTQAVEAMSAVQVMDQWWFAAVNLLEDLPKTTTTTTTSSQIGSLVRMTPQLPQPPLLAMRFPNLTTTPQSSQNPQYYLYDYEIPPLVQCLTLTSEEQEIFNLLCRVRDAKCPETTLRVAGGWVRDKLLWGSSPTTALSSYDIDIVLSSHCTGREFAQHVKTYLQQVEPQQQQQQSSPILDHFVANVTIQDYGATSAEHLQTACIRFGNRFDVDLAQLRHERYQKGARIPEIANSAVVVQDAWRRDLTINCLYYNLHSRQIEDWTEQGLMDLQYGILRTPSAPLATLLEDPVRWLRTVRLAAQLSGNRRSRYFPFRLDPALARAGTDARVTEALQKTVSRNRCGKEVHGLFAKSANPVAGLRLLSDSQLQILFGQPLADSAAMALTSLARTQTLVSRTWPENSDWDVSRRTSLWYAAWYYHASSSLSSSHTVNVATTEEQSSWRPHRRRCRDSILYQSLTTGLGLAAQESQTIEQLIQGAHSWQQLLLACEKENDDATWEAIGNLAQPTRKDNNISANARVADLRWRYYQILKQMGPLWRESLVLMLANNANVNESLMDVDGKVKQFKLWLRRLESTLGLVDNFVFHKTPPALNGSDIISLLPSIQGKQFRQVMEAQEEWRVRQGVTLPTESSRKQLVEFLRQKFSGNKEAIGINVK